MVMRLIHSTSPSKSASGSSSKNVGDISKFHHPYGGVTHVQCFPPQFPCPCSPLCEPTSAGNSHTPAFASACSLGVVRIWRLLPNFYSANEGEGAIDDDPTLGEQAIIQVPTLRMQSMLILSRLSLNSFPLISDLTTFWNFLCSNSDSTSTKQFFPRHIKAKRLRV